ncbi:MAG TPA: sigma-70 family RNA polymerase sigma factor [Nocardioidaceae bacterium]|nr:sigma-70 family RNA polymerase sigma factor [Nocardioidaceae bacterium]
MTNSVPEEMLSMVEQQSASRSDAAMPARDELVDVLFRRHYASLLRLAVVMLGTREAAEDAVQEAFVALHRNYASLRDPEAAEDAVQEAFVALHRNFRSLRDPEAAEAYLRSAVLNRSRSWVRRQVTQRAARPLMLVREQHESPEERVVERDEVGSLVSVMRTLPRRQREVLACRYVLELSVAETAQLLEISEGSVKSHTHRGLQSLQQRIEVAR